MSACFYRNEKFPKNEDLCVLIVRNEWDQECLQYIIGMTRILLDRKHQVYLEANSFTQIIQMFKPDYPNEENINIHPIKDIDSLKKNQTYSIQQSIHQFPIDLIITVGGDGTILHSLTLFGINDKIPHMILFQKGTIGFMCIFPLENYKEILEVQLNKIRDGENIQYESKSCLQGTLQYKNGERAEETEVYQVLNEFVISRGIKPNVLPLEIWVNNILLTNSLGDGLIFSTPTGSTAYNLSAGGPILYQNIEAIILTPICPLSLSFRPIVLPHCIDIRVCLNPSKITKEALIMHDGMNGQTFGTDQEFIIKYLLDVIKVIQIEGYNKFNSWVQQLDRIIWNKMGVDFNNQNQ